MHADTVQAGSSHDAFPLFIGILCFAPLAFGTVEVWSLLIVEAGLFAACSYQFYRRGTGIRDVRAAVPGVVPLTLLLGYIAFQSVPLPPSVIRAISPAAAERYHLTVWLLDSSAWTPVSLYPKGTVAELFRVACFGSAYVLAVGLFSEDNRLRRAALILTVYAGALSLFAILQHLTSNGRIYWLRELTQGGAPFGPFVNRNHFAGLIAMLLPFCFAFFLATRPKTGGKSLREKTANMLGHVPSNVSLLTGFGTLLAALAVFLSLSRGGILSLLGSFCFMGMLFHSRDRKGRMALLIFLVVVFYAVGWFGWEPIFRRFQAFRSAQGEISELRIDLWRDTVRMIADFAATGTGAGTFLQAYPAYRSISAKGIADHAHNDYLELFATLGMIGSALLAWFVFAVLLDAYRTFLKRNNGFARRLFTGAAAGCIAFLLSGLADFNFFIGANGLVFFLLLGVSVAASRVGSRDNRTSLVSAAPATRSPLPWMFGLLLAASVMFNAGQLLASVLRSDVSRVQTESASPESRAYARDTAFRAALLDPLEPGHRLLRVHAEALPSDTRSAAHHLSAAVRLSPADALVLQEAASVFEKGGDTQFAEQLYASGLNASPSEPRVIRAYAGFLLRHGRREEALSLFRKAISHEPDQLREYTALLVLEGLSNQDILRVLPVTAAARIGFAEYLDATGSKDEALSVFQESVKLIDDSPPEQQGLYWQTARFAEKQGDIREALEIMRRAASRFPNDAGTALAVGRYAERMGYAEEAAAAYRRVLAITPDNKTALNRLKALSGP